MIRAETATSYQVGAKADTTAMLLSMILSTVQ